MEDSRIVELYWARDQSAIQESSAKYGRLLHRIACNILSSPEDSEECVNDTYCKAWNTMPPQRPGNLSAYLGRIVRTVSINRWHENRARKRGGEALLSELSDCIPDTAPTPEAAAELSEVTEAIRRWLAGLPREDRTLFLRRYWFGDGLNRLAEELNTSPNRLAGRMYRLRQKLKTALEQEGICL